MPDKIKYISLESVHAAIDIIRTAAQHAVMKRICDAIQDCIDSFPTADVRPNKHSVWVTHEFNHYECFNCGFDSFKHKPHYCESCGCEMENCDIDNEDADDTCRTESIRSRKILIDGLGSYELGGKERSR